MNKWKLIQVEHVRSLKGKKDQFLRLYRRCLILALDERKSGT